MCKRMRKSICRLLVLTMVFAAVFAGASGGVIAGAAGEDNTLFNFENGETHGFHPWNEYATVEVDTSMAYAGESSLKVSFSLAPGQATQVGLNQVDPKPQIVTPTTMRARVYVPSSLNVDVAFRVYDVGWANLSEYKPTIYLPKDQWYEFVVPNVTFQLYAISIVINNSTEYNTEDQVGEIWIDSITYDGYGEEPEPEPGDEIVLFDFEDGIQGMEVVNGTATLEHDTTKAYQGQGSVKVTFQEPSGVQFDLGMYNQSLNIPPGSTIKARVYFPVNVWAGLHLFYSTPNKWDFVALEGKTYEAWNDISIRVAEDAVGPVTAIGFQVFYNDAGPIWIDHITYKLEEDEPEPPAQPETILKGPETVQAGDEFEVTMALSTAQHVYAQDITISFDAEIFELVAVEAADEQTQIVDMDLTQAGTIRAIVANIGGLNQGADILTLRFRAKEAAEDTIGAIVVDNAELGTAPEGEIIVALPTEISISVIVETGIAGDVNGDGIVNIGDLAIVAYYYGSDSSSGNWNEARAADVNGDNVVDILDLAFVANIILTN